MQSLIEDKAGMAGMAGTAGTAGAAAAAAAAHGKPARLDFILKIAHESGFAHVDDLASALEVSRMTIHRDLDELHQRGLLRKVRGGASPSPSTQFEADLDYRRKSHQAEKRAIAQAAIELVEVGDVVMMDDSTTGIALVPHFSQFDSLTVITNFLPVMEALKGNERISLIGIGGQYSKRYDSFLGVVCEETVAKLAADIMFLSTSSIFDTTLYHQDQLQVSVKRAMLSAANKRVLLIDNSKIGHRALYRLCDASEFTHVIVDKDAPTQAVQALTDQGVNVIVAT